MSHFKSNHPKKFNLIPTILDFDETLYFISIHIDIKVYNILSLSLNLFLHNRYLKYR